MVNPLVDRGHLEERSDDGSGMRASWLATGDVCQIPRFARDDNSPARQFTITQLQLSVSNAVETDALCGPEPLTEETHYDSLCSS